MNVKQMVMNMLKNNSNPIFANLIQLAEQNNTKGVEEFARNYYKGIGKDFDKEFEAFKNQMMNSGINYKE